MTMTSEDRRVRSWNGAPFTARVLDSGRVGLIERGAAGDIPAEIVRIAGNLCRSGVPSCSFYWREFPDSVICRVSMTRAQEGASEYALVSGDAVAEYPHGLSAREICVLTLMLTGMSNTELATELWISERTAASHVNRVLRKLGVASRTAAATIALDSGLLMVPPPGSPEKYARLTLGQVLFPPEDGPARSAPSSTRNVPGRSPGARRELVVGAAVPRSGKGSDDGLEMLNGMHLAIEEINRAGGVRGRTLRPLVVDVDVTSPSSVRSAFGSLLTGGADVITSGYLAAQDVAHDVAGASGIPYLHAATSGVMERAVASDLARFGHVFQLCASDTTYAPTFVSYMTALRDGGMLPRPPRRLILLTKPWSHVDFGVSEAITLATEQGWDLECVPVAGPEDGDAWFRAARKALREPTAAMMIGSYLVDDAVQAVSALREMKSPALAYSTYAPSVPAFRDRLGDDAEGVLWSTMTGTYSDPTGVAFSRRYRERFGVAPGRSHAGIAYDRIHMIALAWRLSDDLSDTNQFAQQMRARPFRGVNGTYNFDTPGQASRSFRGHAGDASLAQPELVFQIQQGQQVIVDGGPFATGSFRAPLYATTARRTA